MKKFSFFAGLLGLFLSSFSTSISAELFGSDWNNCCQDWSICNGKFTAGADWLYWKTDSHLNFGTLTRGSESRFRNKNLRPDFEFTSGYRVNLGYEFQGDSWDLAVIYTNLPTRNRRNHSNSFHDESVSVVRIESPISLFGRDVESLRSRYSLNLSYLDLDIGRKICFGECFSIRPHIGARFYWLDQKIRLRMETPFEEATTHLAGHYKEKFNGYGIEGGFWGDWKIGYGFSIIGHVGGSVLYSHFHVRAGNKESTDTDAMISEFKYKDRFWRAVPSFDYFIGLQYATCMFDTYISAHAGWEQRILIDINQMGAHHNLATQGLTLGLDVAF